MKILNNFFGRVFAGFVLAYQRTLSPDHGFLKPYYPFGFCKFYPTCSEYTRQAFLKFGFVKGLLLFIARISKCHPWREGGVDSLPNKS